MWNQLDDDHKRCLADYHMTLLLNSELLNQNWTHHCGQFQSELQRIGCVLKRTCVPGQNERALRDNIESIMLFNGEIVRLRNDYDKSKDYPIAEPPEQSQSLEEEWTTEEWAK